MRLFATLAVALSVVALPVCGADAADGVDLELVLAVDISRSMDQDEQALQRQGYVNAFRHSDVINAIADGARGRIAVTYVEWAGVGLHLIKVPWTIIASRADAEGFADKIAAAPMDQQGGTSISSGLLFAAAQFQKSSLNADRQAVDVSGDGPNNMGVPVDDTRDWVVRQGITINGLPIMLKDNDGPYGIANLDVYYEDCVIGGPGAFMIAVEDMQRFEMAVRRKLVLEISGLPPRVMQAAEVVRSPPRVDCQVGEKARRLLELNRD